MSLETSFLSVSRDEFCFTKFGEKMKYNLKTKSNRKRKRTHGFKKRMKSHHGRLVLKRRRQKGRHKLTI